MQAELSRAQGKLTDAQDQLAAAQARIASDERRFAQAVEAGNLAVWEYDIPNRRIISNSRSLKEQHIIPDGRTLAAGAASPDSYPGMGNVPWSMVEQGYIAEESVDDYVDIYARVLAGQRKVSGAYWSTPRGSWEKVYKQVIYTVDVDDAGKPTRAFGIGCEATVAKREQERYEREVRNLMEATPGLLSASAINLTRNERRLEYSAPGYEESLPARCLTTSSSR